MARSKSDYDRVDDVGCSGSNSSHDAHSCRKYCFITNLIASSVLNRKFKLLCTGSNTRFIALHGVMIGVEKGFVRSSSLMRMLNYPSWFGAVNKAFDNVIVGNISNRIFLKSFVRFLITFLLGFSQFQCWSTTTIEVLLFVL